MRRGRPYPSGLPLRVLQGAIWRSRAHQRNAMALLCPRVASRAAVTSLRLKFPCVVNLGHGDSLGDRLVVVAVADALEVAAFEHGEFDAVGGVADARPRRGCGSWSRRGNGRSTPMSNSAPRRSGSSSSAVMRATIRPT